MLGSVFGSGNTAENKTDLSPSPHEAYIPVAGDRQ